MTRSLALIVVAALAACTPEPAPEAPTEPARSQAAAVDVPPFSSEADAQGAIQCLTFIQLELEAMKHSSPGGDAAELEAALASWRARAKLAYTDDELAKAVARNAAIMGDMSTTEIKGQAADCVAISDQTDL